MDDAWVSRESRLRLARISRTLKGVARRTSPDERFDLVDLAISLLREDRYAGQPVESCVGRDKFRVVNASRGEHH